MNARMDFRDFRASSNNPARPERKNAQVGLSMYNYYVFHMQAIQRLISDTNLHRVRRRGKLGRIPILQKIHWIPVFVKESSHSLGFST